LLAALAAARGVDAGEVAARYAENKEKIPEAIHAARVHAVKTALHEPRY
jgi:tRNA nucleotidyltransferase (CCA-adding enzyme)